MIGLVLWMASTPVKTKSHQNPNERQHFNLGEPSNPYYHGKTDVKPGM